MALQLYAGTFRRDATWTKEDKIYMWKKLGKLYDRALDVERCEHPLEEWLGQESIQKVRSRVEKKRKQISDMLQLRNIRRLEIVQSLPRAFRHIESRDSEMTVKMMQNAVHEIKHKRNLVNCRKIALERSHFNLKIELERLSNSQKKIPKLYKSTDKKCYVDYQDISTRVKAAKYINASYKKAIEYLMKESLTTKADLHLLQRDVVEMSVLTNEVEFSLKENRTRLKYFSHEFENRYRRYRMLEHNFERQMKKYLEEQDRQEVIQRKIEQKVQRAKEIPQWDNQTIQDLKTNVEEAESKIRSLQTATRCLEPRGIEARLTRQLPDAERFKADTKRLREVRVSLTEKRKESEIQHDRYLQEADVEFRKNEERIAELRKKIEAQRNRKLKHLEEAEVLRQHRIQLKYALGPLQRNLRKVRCPEDAGHEKRPCIVLNIDEGVDDSQVKDKSRDSDEGLKILSDVGKRCEVLVQQFDFNLPAEVITNYEHQLQDSILEENAASAKIKNSDFLAKAKRKEEKDIFLNIDLAHDRERKNIKRNSDDIVRKNKLKD